MTSTLLALLVFPGVLFAVPMGWLMLGLERKVRARLQGRIGPPLVQPFDDFIKLLGKTPVHRDAHDLPLLTGLPLLAIGAVIGGLAMLPIQPDEAGVVGDLILIVSLLELPPLCLVLAGYASRSVYGQVGATREAVIGIASTVPFIGALAAMAASCGSLRLPDMVAATPWGVRIPALAAVLLCIPAKLKLNPFSISNAEQEVLAGPLTEMDGKRLGLWELAHALEWVATAGLVTTLAVPVRSAVWWVNALLFCIGSALLVVMLATIAAATARLKLPQATRWLWRWASLPALVALAMAILSPHEGP